MAAAREGKMLYVGGLDDAVTDELVLAAFIPFGDVKEVIMPPDPETSEPAREHRRAPTALPTPGAPLETQRSRAAPASARGPLASPPSPPLSRRSLSPPCAASHRGFAFVVFEEAEDAAEAKDNMDGAELFGRVLRVSDARPGQAGSGAVWEDADKWYKEVGAGAKRSHAQADAMLRKGPDADMSEGR